MHSGAMQFDFLQNEHEMRAFAFAVGVLALSILAIVAFAVSGSSWVFYVFAVLAIALGLYMAYHVSNPTRQQPAKQAGRKKR